MDAEGKLRLWRNTSVATLTPGQTATLGPNTLGYEWDEDLDNGARPPGLVRLSSATWDEPSWILDYGSNYGPGTATHHLTLYRHASGALVFGAGSVQWSWGLDGYNTPEWHSERVSEAAQRITRNILDRMLRTETVPHRKETDWGPSPIVLLASVVAMAFVVRAWFWRRMKNQ